MHRGAALQSRRCRQRGALSHGRAPDRVLRNAELRRESLPFGNQAREIAVPCRRLGSPVPQIFREMNHDEHPVARENNVARRRKRSSN